MADSTQRVVVTVNGQEFLVEVHDLTTTPVIAVIDGQAYEVYLGDEVTILPKGSAPAEGAREAIDPARETPQKQTISAPADHDEKFRVSAPMPGDIVEVCVQPGQRVKVGDSLCVLDAMKMKNIIHSPRDGLISSVDVSRGQSVDYGDPLVTYD